MRWRLPDNVHGYINRHGKAVFYLRLPGAKKVRLRGHPGSPEFMTAYEAARAGKESPGLGAARTIPGTVNAAIVGYYQSSSFKDGLAKSTQSSRRAILERFREDHGDKRALLMHSHAL